MLSRSAKLSHLASEVSSPLMCACGCNRRRSCTDLSMFYTGQSLGLFCSRLYSTRSEAVDVFPLTGVYLGFLQPFPLLLGLINQFFHMPHSARDSLSSKQARRHSVKFSLIPITNRQCLKSQCISFLSGCRWVFVNGIHCSES